VNVPVNGWAAIRFVADNPGEHLICFTAFHFPSVLVSSLVVLNYGSYFAHSGNYADHYLLMQVLG